MAQIRQGHPGDRLSLSLSLWLQVAQVGLRRHQAQHLLLCTLAQRRCAVRGGVDRSNRWCYGVQHLSWRFWWQAVKHS